MKHFLKFALLAFVYTASAFDLEDYATTYRATRDAYLKAANELKLATGPYKAARDAYVAATATYTKSLYERRRLGEADGVDAKHLKILQSAYWNAASSESAGQTAESIVKFMGSFNNQPSKGRKLFDLEDYASTYRATRDAYLKAANELKLATGPYKAARDAYVAATATYTKSLYERRRLGENKKLTSASASHLKVLQDAYWKAGSSDSASHTAEAIEKILASM